MDASELAIGLALSTAASVGGAWWCLQRLTQLHYLLDTPTSKIRSAAQGYTELFGILQALPETPVFAPLTGKPCVWWRFKIEAQERDGKRRNWRALESGSSEVWLELADATGKCLINPQGAEVRPLTREVWTGNQRHPRRDEQRNLLLGLLTGGRHYRYTEERLHAGEPLYAIGEFRTTGGGQQAFDPHSAQGALVREWKEDFAGLLQRFDRDASGQLDAAEWQQVRQAAGIAATRRQRQASLAPAQHQLLKPGEAQPFILSSRAEDDLVRRFRWQAAAGAVGCLAGALATAWLLNSHFG
ncbi:GIDE domain-containing protein [Pseudomonas sp. N040]|uniref:GIDE domain-containing protein n=1 Tax=Pseudomonas sp. N040 TaxID=2785325 RepID=UPI0018A249B2|nr:GIDE domain-containing protein [Pseudomonas sp. N040]MBF7728467.1 hypothetical protein [Pseudomonas sp. N040]MBW7012107.1 E3 ubiquitin ligase family protein [Pseudomonas sp. N040]